MSQLTLFACGVQIQRFGQMVHSPAHLCGFSLIALLLTIFPRQRGGGE